MILVTGEEMRELERRAVENGISEIELMAAAGRGAADMVYRFAQTLPPQHRRRVVVVCGRGNNGGDGLKVAGELLEHFHLPVAVYSVAPVYKMSEPCRFHGRRLSVRPAAELDLQSGDLVVDALLGTGLTGALNPPYDELIRKINAARLPVVSLDCPSGLECNNGTVNPCAVVASFTVTFGYPKIGLTRGDAGKYCGPIRVVKLPVPEPASGAAELETHLDVAAFLAALPHEAHKNSRPRVGVVGGSPEYQGAPQLAAIAALRAGAGLVQLATFPDMRLRVPLALVLRPVDNLFSGAETLVETSDVSVIGPGWCGPHAGLFRRLLALPRPLVLDAEALNMISLDPSLLAARPDGVTTVLTPHLGEIRRLERAFNLKEDASHLEQAAELARAANAVVVLKCAKTVIASPAGRVAVNASGCPALATAGSGDVLTGVVAAMIGKEPAERHFDAVAAGVYLHGLAGELHPSAQRAVIADDLPELVASALRAVSPLA